MSELKSSSSHCSWILSYHEHEALLQENEDEKLSKEEQDLAWEVYEEMIKAKAAQHVSPNKQCVIFQQHSVESLKNDPSTQTAGNTTCTKATHLLTLRSQGIKMGCSTICEECDREISLEDLNC